MMTNQRGETIITNKRGERKMTRRGYIALSEQLSKRYITSYWYIWLNHTFGWMNAFGNWFAKIFKWIVFWTSSSPYFIRGSRWDNDNSFQLTTFSSFLFSPPNARKFDSLKWQSANRAMKKYPIVGSRYLIIDGETYLKENSDPKRSRN